MTMRLDWGSVVRYALGAAALAALVIVAGCASIQDADDGPGRLSAEVVLSGTPHYIAPTMLPSGEYGFRYAPLPAPGESGAPTPTPTSSRFRLIDASDSPGGYPRMTECVLAGPRGWFYEPCPSALHVGRSFDGAAALTAEEIAAAGTAAASASDYDTERERAVIRRDLYFATSTRTAAYLADPGRLVELLYDGEAHYQGLRLRGGAYEWVELTPVVRGPAGRDSDPAELAALRSSLEGLEDRVEALEAAAAQ